MKYRVTVINETGTSLIGCLGRRFFCSTGLRGVWD